jgi:hypothetical protein
VGIKARASTISTAFVGVMRDFSDLGIVSGLGCVSVAGLCNPTFGNEVRQFVRWYKLWNYGGLATDEHGQHRCNTAR